MLLVQSHGLDAAVVCDADQADRAALDVLGDVDDAELQAVYITRDVDDAELETRDRVGDVDYARGLQPGHCLRSIQDACYLNALKFLGPIAQAGGLHAFETLRQVDQTGCRDASPIGAAEIQQTADLAATQPLSTVDEPRTSERRLPCRGCRCRRSRSLHRARRARRAARIKPHRGRAARPRGCSVSPSSIAKSRCSAWRYSVTDGINDRLMAGGGVWMSGVGELGCARSGDAGGRVSAVAAAGGGASGFAAGSFSTVCASLGRGRVLCTGSGLRCRDRRAAQRLHRARGCRTRAR